MGMVWSSNAFGPISHFTAVSKPHRWMGPQPNEHEFYQPKTERGILYLIIRTGQGHPLFSQAKAWPLGSADDLGRRKNAFSPLSSVPQTAIYRAIAPRTGAAMGSAPPQEPVDGRPMTWIQ